MIRLFQKIVIAIVMVLNVTGIAVGYHLSDWTLLVVCAIGLMFATAWAFLLRANKPKRDLPSSQLDGIGAHIQDTTVLTGSSTQIFISLS